MTYLRLGVFKNRTICLFISTRRIVTNIFYGTNTSQILEFHFLLNLPVSLEFQDKKDYFCFILFVPLK